MSIARLEQRRKWRFVYMHVEEQAGTRGPKYARR
jgi:hypothetical protein